MFGCASSAAMVASRSFRLTSSIRIRTRTPRSAARTRRSTRFRPVASVSQRKYWTSRVFCARSASATRAVNAGRPRRMMRNADSPGAARRVGDLLADRRGLVILHRHRRRARIVVRSTVAQPATNSGHHGQHRTRSPRSAAGNARAKASQPLQDGPPFAAQPFKQVLLLLGSAVADRGASAAAAASHRVAARHDATAALPLGRDKLSR